MANKVKQIKWGIIGLGKIAHKFAQDLNTISNCELYAVASRSQMKADEFATKFQAKKAYNSYSDLAEDPEINAVYIATPHAFHKEHSLLCLNKGIAVLCEKPFAMNLEEVSEMISVAKAEKVLLMEALWTAFLPHFQHSLKILKEKTLGDITSLEADFGFSRPFDDNSRLFKKSLGGGSLLDIGIYPIFATLSILGSPHHIEAQATFFENGADASCTVTFHYKNGLTAHLKSTLLEETPTEAHIHCEHGTLLLNKRFHEPTSITTLLNSTTNTLDFPTQTFGYNYEIEHFNQLLRDGKTESDIMTFKISEQLIRTLDDVRKVINLKYD
ncbi:Gfo/Idh/MocA family protein [Geojedonia litorea]|uniref:Gfo/Idh/MocA family protein n=1 Tax=Geojedonia litorea TaxID=1268269 RepID=A0ABV9N4U8_9FLAO